MTLPLFLLSGFFADQVCNYCIRFFPLATLSPSPPRDSVPWLINDPGPGKPRLHPSPPLVTFRPAPFTEQRKLPVITIRTQPHFKGLRGADWKPEEEIVWCLLYLRNGIGEEDWLDSVCFLGGFHEPHANTIFERRMERHGINP